MSLNGRLTSILATSLTCPLWRALAVIGIDSIYTGSSVGTLMTGAIVNVVLTVCSIETWYR